MATMRESLIIVLLNYKLIFLLVYPLLLIFLFSLDIFGAKSTGNAWLYITFLMIGFWILEPLPIGVTSLIPLVLFPLLAVLNTKKTCFNYFHDLNMTLIAALLLGLSAEMCNLHTRTSLRIIKLVGFRYHLLSLFFTILTIAISMFFSNTTTTCFMMVIVKEVLHQMDDMGLAKMWLDEDQQNPTHLTKGFYLGTAYMATIGGLGTLMGSGTNLAFHELVPTNFGVWFALNLLLIILTAVPTWAILQYWYLGWGRPSSRDSLAITFTTEEIEIANENLNKKLSQLEKWSHHEIFVLIIIIVSVVLLFLRRVTFMNPWPTWITETKVGDATTLTIFTVLLFVVPSRPEFWHIYDKDESKRPIKTSPGLITWKWANQRMHWSLIFVMGGAFALADALDRNGYIKFWDYDALSYDKQIVGVLVTVVVMTQFMANADLVKIFVPLMVSIGKRFSDVPQMYYMLPVVWCCSFAFVLPVGTPPNAIVGVMGNIKTVEFVKIGLVVLLVAIVMMCAIFFLLVHRIW
ncbi:protein I'm not dead yet [Tribolium castaneum]|uniref:Protein I'm not dead yet-like Protein n=1 Tax=Tribolium castaneum TaxID=7070 RepID=D2A4Q4_TRICA|nr:PREDICTED: protein I'm not dead yet [Tribolium castaneum]EFA05252.2 Protein I'm not dead yet-like Protein [Tribolium castaneum]|eukprot:XP_972020.3 PREDICTED: protein I'm not dead yet [Tribolium castaneum]